MRYFFLAFVVVAFASTASLYAAEPATNAAPGALSPELRAKVREVNEKFRAEQTALYKRLQIARRELEQTIQSESLNDKGIREKATIIGEIEGELAILRGKHYRELGAVLPPGQLTNGFALGTNLFSPRLNNIGRSKTNTVAP